MIEMRDEDLNEITASIINRMAFCSFDFTFPFFFVKFPAGIWWWFSFPEFYVDSRKKSKRGEFKLNKELSGKGDSKTSDIWQRYVALTKPSYL